MRIFKTFLILALLLVNQGQANIVIPSSDFSPSPYDTLNYENQQLNISLEFVKKIGKLESKDENELLYGPLDVAVDDDDNIYILELENSSIQKFDKNGKHVKTIGGPGQGPGELSRPVSIQIMNGMIYTADNGNSRINVYNLEGENFLPIKINERMVTMSIMNSKEIVAATHHALVTLQEENSFGKEELLSKFSPDGNLTKRFGKFERHNDKNYVFYLNEIFLDTDSNDNIYLSFKHYNRIEKYSPNGDLLFKTNGRLNFGLDHVNVDRVEKLTHVFAGIGIDHKERIWVPTFNESSSKNKRSFVFEKEDKFDLEVFNNSGKYLGKIPVKNNFKSFRVVKDKIFFIEPWNEVAVYEYRITEN